MKADRQSLNVMDDYKSIIYVKGLKLLGVLFPREVEETCYVYNVISYVVIGNKVSYVDPFPDESFLEIKEQK